MNTSPLRNDPAKRDPRVIRVLIVDDSPLINSLFKAMLDGLPDIQVIGEATNGQDAIRMAMRLRPNVITMDIRMPQMDGLEAIRQIMSIQPTPIIVVSSSVYAADFNTAFSAIESGALTVIEKPRGLDEKDFDSVREQLITSIRTLSGVTLIPRQHKKADRAANVGAKTAMLHSYVLRAVQAVAIASSTGGPPVLAEILSSLPEGFSIPILIVQHNLPAFMPAMVEWLNTRTKIPVAIAKEGMLMDFRHIYVAPGDAHLTVNADRTLHVDQSPPVKGYRPSATRLFQSVASAFDKNAIGIVLTGMGEDGVDGLAVMAAAGAHIMAQDEFSSVVFGMPKAAIDRNIVDEILSPEEIVARLTKLHHHMNSPHRG
jgi:two-component system chemotaxis response regulator CheB